MGCSGSAAGGRSKARSFARDAKAIEGLLQSTKADAEAKINANYSLNIDKKIKSHLEFITKVGKLKFPNIRNISLTNMSVFDAHESKEFQEFFGHSFPNAVDYFHISSGGKPAYPKIDGFFEELVDALSRVYEEVFIDGFEFTSAQFEKLVRSCRGVRTLVFLNCNISLMKGSKLDLGSTLKYRIQTLDIFNSYHPTEKKYLNLEGLDVLAEAIALTNLCRCLNSLHLTSYRNKDKQINNQQETDIFVKHNVDCLINADNEWPNPGGSKGNKTKATTW